MSSVLANGHVTTEPLAGPAISPRKPTISPRKIAANIRRVWHRTVGTQTYELSGVRLRCGPNDLPRFVRGEIFKGTYEAAEARLVRRVVRPGTRVVEFGTGIGFISILCSQLAGQGNVRSYEANPHMEPVIRANYMLNGMEPDLVMRAVTVDGSPISFFRDDNILSSSTFDRDRQAQRIEVESDSIRAVLAEAGPEVVVMDIEGAETDVLAAASLAQTNVRALIIELHPHIVGENAVGAMIAKLHDDGFAVAAGEGKTVLCLRDVA